MNKKHVIKLQLQLDYKGVTSEYIIFGKKVLSVSVACIFSPSRQYPFVWQYALK